MKLFFRIGIALTLVLAAVIIFTGSGNSYSLCRIEGDLDGDGLREEYCLENHVLTIKEGPQELWKSPSGYFIDSFALGDVDNDNEMNLVVSLWKIGSFGDMRPFWSTGQDLDYKNHIFVYRLVANKPEQVWCSSNLERPTLSFSIEDNNEDGLNEMVVVEGKYKELSPNRFAVDSRASSRTTVWRWNEWGFELCKSTEQ